jgi:predicted glycosyl hydrolase (DUF1957 family)
MDEKIMLQDLKQHMQQQLKMMEREILLSDPRDDDEVYNFLIKKAINHRDVLKKIEVRLSELNNK